MARIVPQILLAALLVTSAVGAEEPQPKRVLLLYQSPDGHPPQTHEYAAGIELLARCLQHVPGVTVQRSLADSPWPEGPGLIRQSDGVVLFVSEGAKWIHEDPRRLEALGQLAERGGGFVALHWAMGTREPNHIDGFLELFGGCHGGPDRKYKVVDTSIRNASPRHPVTQGLNDFKVRDEFYYGLKFVDGNRRIEPLIEAKIEDSWHPVAWAWQRGDGGHSFGFSGLHFHKNWQLLEYRRLVMQGVIWTLKLPIPEGGLEAVQCKVQ